MKIVVLSDTHIPKRGHHLPKRMINDLESADYIIHAGDWQTVELLEELRQFSEVIGVTGNVDSPELKTVLRSKELFHTGDFKIGIVHGHGTGKTTEKRSLDAFSDDPVDCIIFGHSHIPVLKESSGILLFNPGSPTDKRRQKEYSYGIITLEEKIQAKHIFFPDKE